MCTFKFFTYDIYTVYVCVCVLIHMIYVCFDNVYAIYLTLITKLFCLIYSLINNQGNNISPSSFALRKQALSGQWEPSHITPACT
jgi:hypothetical protein